MELCHPTEQSEYLSGRTVYNVESDDGFRREELEQSMAPGKHSTRGERHFTVGILYLVFVIGLIMGMVVMDILGR